jgi:exonuclease III
MMLSEVGGLESLENFNHHFLKDEYYIAFIEGNSDRFIHVAYLIHKDVNFQFEVRTNKAKKIKIEEYNKTFEKTFSRDVLELFLYDGDNEDPSLILLTSHLKSQISSDYDPKGHYKRSAEFKALLEIFADLKSQYSCPIVVGGDLNFTLEEKDRDLLTTVGLMEMHQFLNSSELERFTHIFFDFEEKMILNQLDYILFSKDLEDKVVKDSSYTYRFKNYYGEPDELPKTIKEKKLNPSDHYPLVFTIKIG